MMNERMNEDKQNKTRTKYMMKIPQLTMLSVYVLCICVIQPKLNHKNTNKLLFQQKIIAICLLHFWSDLVDVIEILSKILGWVMEWPVRCSWHCICISKNWVSMFMMHVKQRQRERTREKIPQIWYAWMQHDVFCLCDK